MPSIHTRVAIRQTQRVALGNLVRPLHNLVLRGDNEVSHLNGMVGRNLRDGATLGSLEDDGLLLIAGQRVKMRLQLCIVCNVQRDKLFAGSIPPAIVAVLVLYIIVVEIGQRQIGGIRALIAQIEAETEGRGIRRILKPCFAVGVIQPLGDAERTHGAIGNVVDVVDLRAVL